MIEKLSFGRTGHNSTRTLFGAAAFMQVDQGTADRTLELLLEYGINHIDTAASYGDSELRLAPWMAKHRHDFFLATKTGERSYEKAKAQIYQSLERLQVDSVDLIQLHNLVDPDEWEEAMGEDGALQAAVEARAEGLVRFIGVTGHGTTVAAMHMKSLEHFQFDSVLLPYNYWMMQNPQYAADFEALTAMCAERQVAVQTIKSIARGPWGDKAQNRATWYEPFDNQVDINRVVQWALERPSVFLNTAGDVDLLPMVLNAAQLNESVNTDVSTLEAAPLFT